MNQVMYEPPPDGVFWSAIVMLFVLAAVVIIYIWSKVGQGKK